MVRFYPNCFDFKKSLACFNQDEVHWHHPEHRSEEEVFVRNSDEWRSKVDEPVRDEGS